MDDEIPKVGSTGLALRILLVALPGLLLLAAVAAWTAGLLPSLLPGGLLPAGLAGGPGAGRGVPPAERAHTLLVREQRESTGRLELAARLLAREPALAELPALPAAGSTTAPEATQPGTTEPGTTETGATEPGATEPGQAAEGAAGEAAPAGPAVPTAALADLLEQRRDELGYDFALVLAPDGRVLAATGELAGLAGRELPAAAGLLQAARDGGSASGAWRHGERLAWLAAARVAPEFDLRGHVAAGTWIAERTALELAGIADAAVLLAVPAESGAGATAGAETGAELDAETGAEPGVETGAEAGAARGTDSGSWRAVAASTGGEAAAALLAALPAPAGLTPGEPREEPVDLPGGARRAVIVPLGQPDGTLAGAAVLATAAAAGGAAGGATAPLVLAVAVAVALLLTLLLAAALARRVVAPVARLTGHVRSAPREGFSRRLDARRHGVLAPLAAALDRLFAGLREERSLTAVAAAANRPGAVGSRSSEARGSRDDLGVLAGTGAAGSLAGAAPAEPPAGPPGEPEVRRAVVLAIDLRGLARASSLGARGTAERLAADVARVRAEVGARGGHLRAAAGHRLLAELGGEGAEARAVAAGAAVLAALGASGGRGLEGGSAGGAGFRAEGGEERDEEREPPAVAIASGSVTMGGQAGAAAESFLPSFLSGFLVGPAVQMADSLLREAAPGDLVMTRAVHAAAEPSLARAGVAASAQRSLLSPQPLYLLAASEVDQLAGEAAPLLPDEAAASRETSPAASPATSPTTSPAAPELVAGRYQVLAAAAEPGGAERVLDRETGEEGALRRLLGLEGGELGFDGPLPALRRVPHPNLARMLDFGDGLGSGYLVREWVPGTPLQALGELPPPAALAVVRQLAAALAALHAEGLAHLRVKPENVLVEPSGRVRLTDAGVGLVEGPAPSASAGDRLLAPEQRDGERGDARSDVWATGALLGRFAAGAWWGERDPKAELPAGLAAVVDRCLQDDPERRYPDAAALAAALDPVTA